MRIKALLVALAIFVSIFPAVALAATPEIEHAMASVTYDVLTDCAPDHLTKSLNLPTELLNGVTVKWSSNNRSVITNAGRVIRPKAGEFDVSVTLTAVFSYEGSYDSKRFNFIVPADETFVDPSNIVDSEGNKNPGEYMTDEEFFGQWNEDDGTWTIEGKFDYTNPKLAGIEAAAKAGDYPKAKEELLAYMRTRKKGIVPSRDVDGARLSTYGLLGYPASQLFSGEWDVLPGGEYREYKTTLRPGMVRSRTEGLTFNIFPAYNDCTEVLIASRHHPNPAYWPRAEVTINGEIKVFTATGSAVIRGGQYKSVNFGEIPELKVKLFGDYMGDDTYQTILKFDFSSIGPDDVVSNPQLVVYCKQGQNFDDTKRLIVSSSVGDMSWTDKSITWDSILWRNYNYNGVPSVHKWYLENMTIPGFDFSSSLHSSYPNYYRPLVAEYNYTKDETYLYTLIRHMTDFLMECGMGNRPRVMDNTAEWNVPDEATVDLPPPRGGYPNPEPTFRRVEAFNEIMDCGLFASKYMTADICSALLKNHWDQIEALMYKNWYFVAVNHRAQGLLHAVTAINNFREFSATQRWFERAGRDLERLMQEYVMADGAGDEAVSGSYLQVSLYSVLDIKRAVGGDVKMSKEAEELLYKWIYYDLLLRLPGNTKLMWGDDTAGTLASNTYTDIMDWYNDPVMRFLDSGGQRGEKPPWTSYQWPIGKQTMMRSGWGNNDLALYTNVRVAGSHGHYDNNSVTAYAYGHTLLADYGFNANAYDSNIVYDGISLALYALDVERHNTVQINGANYDSPRTNNAINDWVTNNSYDFLSQTSTGYAAANHKRTITFLKPYFWIVSDLMTPPSTSTSKNTYRQLWHMFADANLSTDSDKRIFSNYPTGANIIVASADREDAGVTIAEKNGYQLSPWRPLKFAYYQRENVVGNATFDTVLLPQNGTDGNINVERINLRVPTSEATAMKFNATAGGINYRVYYMLDYEHNPDRTRTFEKYTSNGQMTLVREAISGSVKEIALTKGGTVSYADGSELLRLGKDFEDFSFRHEGYKLVIETSHPIEDLSGVRLTLKNADVRTVEFNGKKVGFNKEGDLIKLYGNNIPAPVVTDPNPPKLNPGLGGGSGGKSGGAVIVNPDTPQVTDTPDSQIKTAVFEDTEGHWGEEYINRLKEKDIVKGNSDGMFYPDSPITRAELLAMVTRSVNIPEKAYSGEFDDVTDMDWYSGVVQAGLDAGLISKDTTFRPNDNITREEMCKIIVEAAELLTYLDSETADGYEPEYTDISDVSDWAFEYVKKASRHGLMSGMDDGSFAPMGFATRAQAAAVLDRLLQRI